MIAILTLISITEQWLTYHKRNGRHIEAAACAIRIKALRDAVKALEGDG